MARFTLVKVHHGCCEHFKALRVKVQGSLRTEWATLKDGRRKRR
jgi:hypothetical protein